MSRPKKRILIVAENDVRASVLRMVLETRGYATAVAQSADEAWKMLAPRGYELLLCDWPLAGIDRVMEAAHIVDVDLPRMVLARGLKERPDTLQAEAVICGNAPMIEILERMRTLMARKRGPRKGYRMMPASVRIADRESMTA